VALADGSVVTCSPDKDRELFYNIPWSHGTLGFLLSAVINIVPCKSYVRLRYFPFTDSKVRKRVAGTDLELIWELEGHVTSHIVVYQPVKACHVVL
jgi:FAD/FMN-containing dehydrogenase